LKTHPNVPPGSYAALTVTDSGTGIDAKTIPSIFEPFFTTKERGRGTGLGLATVHGIVRQNGGWIVVDSVVGRGTSFTIYLPRTNAPAEPVSARSAISTAHTRGQGTILIVEDQEQIRDLIVYVLKDLGYLPLAAPNGEACLKLAQELERIDLVITDVVLPKMSGPELVERLLERQPSLKVLYISGYPKDLVMAGPLKTTGLVYLQKPFSPSELAAKVEGILA
jgi:two-component system cell cycle sensor histidine kinase/response regulator CckA